MKITQIRGALLEEVILRLLENVGYKIVQPNEEGCRLGRSGLEVRGRGEWHQIDALAGLSYTPAFMYPLRLILEAKCYKDTRHVGIHIPRNALGVLKDIQENYFTYSSNNMDELLIQRYNYHSAIFSTSEYTSGAQRFAIAHQIFLITYAHVPIMQSIAENLLSLYKDDFKIDLKAKENLRTIRNEFNRLFNSYSNNNNSNIFSDTGIIKLNSIFYSFNKIKGSYFGMLQGKYPMHLISQNEINRELFWARDEIPCKLFSHDRRYWYFAPSEVDSNTTYYFELEFNLPKEIATIINDMTSFQEIARIKSEAFSFIDLSGRINGVQRLIRLRLDRDWLSQFIENYEQ